MAFCTGEFRDHLIYKLRSYLEHSCTYVFSSTRHARTSSRSTMNSLIWYWLNLVQDEVRLWVHHFQRPNADDSDFKAVKIADTMPGNACEQLQRETNPGTNLCWTIIWFSLKQVSLRLCSRIFPAKYSVLVQFGLYFRNLFSETIWSYLGVLVDLPTVMLISCVYVECTMACSVASR